MLDIFQCEAPANLTRGTNPSGSGTAWLFQVNASAVSPFVNYALPHPPEGTTAMADRPQLTTGVTTGALARFS
jgi:hypothetical protein